MCKKCDKINNLIQNVIKFFVKDDKINNFFKNVIEKLFLKIEPSQEDKTIKYLVHSMSTTNPEI